MNIFFMNSSGTAIWGGNEKWMLQTGLEFRKHGHNVYFGGRKASLFLKKCREATFPVLELNIGLDFDPLVVKTIFTFLKSHHIEVILTGQNKDVRLAGVASKLNRQQQVVIARNGLPNIKNNFRYRLIYPRLLDGIIVNTQAIKQKYLSYQWLHSDFIRVIPNGIYPSHDPEPNHNHIKSQLRIPSDKAVIGIFGILHKQKQHTIFLEIASNILKHFPDTVFLIVGDGPERENLQNYAFELGILDNVYMTGFQEDTISFYEVCDIVLLTSQDEGLPNSVMEAMSMKKPVVAFDVGGVSELIHPERNGILVPPNDIYLMTQQVEQLLLNKDYATQLGNCAREHISNNFSFQTMIGATETYLNEKLRNKRGEANGT